MNTATPVIATFTLALLLAAGCAGPKVTPEPTAPHSAPATAPVSAAPIGAGPAAPTLASDPSGEPALAAQPVSERPLVAESPDGVLMPVLHTIKQDTGLIIEDLRMGDGPDCMPSSQVTVRYHGTLVNGVVFDSTRGKPSAEFPLDRLIRGWREGLPGMKVGGIRRLTIPSALAYGDRQKGIIPPNSDLVFSIELQGVK